jgi:tetratricopeptide (TPR) repeat protein
LLRVSSHDPDALRAMITCRQRLSMNLCWKGSALAERDGVSPEVSAIADEAVKHANAALETCAELERLDKPGYQTSNYRIKLTADLGLAMILRRDEKSVELLSHLLDSARARAESDLSNREARIDIALVHSYLGRAYAARHEWTGAIVNYRQSLLVFDEVLVADRENSEIPANKAEVLLQLGNALYQSGDYRSASAAYDRIEAISSPSVFLKSVLLNSARGDLEMSRAHTRLPRIDSGDGFTIACSRYQQALDSISTFDLKRDHIDHTFFSDVLERKLQTCKNGSGLVAAD